ncbi:glycosyltransferase family 2 protein [Bradyrhizobium sp. 174]|uniref:glycosyltransferase family 2 protein n=1 Tax=Bradyrhizobium sp. 174 TaxID=2782645 RepID=UPI001FF81D32|nr:glycosyltransferase family 2 protein [Bradyrhizobium sp. 174]MCK1573659.1 glycosyltransferase family 2 protein [Bradyrhizobium sp. 174]
MASLAVVILTFNEELHLARALNGVAGMAKEIFVIDSCSSDQTREIAKRYGAVVIEHPFLNYAKQFQWALDNAPITADWIMRLDADEIVEADLATEIEDKLPILPNHVVGINLKRKLVFMNRTINYGGRRILVLLRIWRRGQGYIEDRWMDEHMVVHGGSTVTFEGGFADHNLNNLGFFTDKHNKYATREAVDALNQRLHFLNRSSRLSVESSSYQAAIKRWIKERVYNKIPFQFSAFAYFLYRYIVLLGFLDGKEGLIYHVLQGFWYRFLVGAKLEELRRELTGLADSEEIRAKVGSLTGLKLDAS